MAERLDDLQNGYYLYQDPAQFCFGLDAVLLSDFVRAQAEDEALDLGCGTGIIPLLLWAKKAVRHITGLELQEEAAHLAEKSVAFNHLEEHIRIVTGDIKEAAGLFGPASFSVVTCNPPYMIGGHGLKNPQAPKSIARHEVACTFADIAAAAAAVLKPKGRLVLVHRPFRLAEIMKTLQDFRLEPKRMQLVYPFVDREPNMVLLEAVSGGRSRLSVESPLIVYRKVGEYTQQVLDAYQSVGVSKSPCG